MKILLLAMPDTGDWLDHVMRLPNLAMVSMAGSLPDHEVRVLDLVLIKENLLEVLDRHLKAFVPELISLSAMTFQYDTMIKLATYLKRRLPGVTLVAGGYHVTLMHREMADEIPPIPLDYMIRGEGGTDIRRAGNRPGCRWRHGRHRGIKLARPGRKVDP